MWKGGGPHRQDDLPIKPGDHGNVELLRQHTPGNGRAAHFANDFATVNRGTAHNLDVAYRASIYIGADDEGRLLLIARDDLWQHRHAAGQVFTREGDVPVEAAISPNENRIGLMSPLTQSDRFR